MSVHNRIKKKLLSSIYVKFVYDHTEEINVTVVGARSAAHPHNGILHITSRNITDKVNDPSKVKNDPDKPENDTDKDGTLITTVVAHAKQLTFKYYYRQRLLRFITI